MNEKVDGTCEHIQGPSFERQMKIRRTNVTAFDVARLAQVSQSAVSRAFTPGAAVAESTRKRILDAAKKLGYRPNAIARSLITNRSRIIGVVVSYFDNQFYPFVLELLSRELRTHGYHLLLFCTQSGDADNLMLEILQYQVDGIVMASTTFSSPLARSCSEAGIPVVLFNRTARNSPSSTVASDNIAGGRLAAELLCAGGHRRMAFIAGLEDTSTSREREQGFLQGLAAHGQRCYARTVGNYHAESAVQAALEMFSRRPAPDAVFVANDHMAIAVMDTLRQHLKLRIPEDVSVVGFDDVPQAAWGSYDLTTIRQPAQSMIAATVALLIRQIGNRHAPPESVVLPVELVMRNTVRVGKDARN